MNPPIPMFPRPVAPRDDVAESAIVLQEEQRVGEVELDAVVRSQSSAPQVVKRFTELENCLWAAAEALVKLSSEDRERIGANQIIDRARILLNGDLEIPLKQSDLTQTIPEAGNKRGAIGRR